MREIKFRAYCNGSMLYRGLHDRNWYNGDDKLVIENHPNDKHFYKVMQYTGLKDKNGVEIYEGDVFRWGVHTGVVEFVAGYFTFNGMGLNPPNTDGVVIGNIYENPELL